METCENSSWVEKRAGLVCAERAPASWGAERTPGLGHPGRGGSRPWSGWVYTRRLPQTSKWARDPSTLKDSWKQPSQCYSLSVGLSFPVFKVEMLRALL